MRSVTPSTARAPPFALRARLLTPLAAGGTRHEPDGLVVVDAAGRLAFAGAAAERPAEAAAAIDLRPWVRAARDGRPARPPAAGAERRARRADSTC